MASAPASRTGLLQGLVLEDRYTLDEKLGRGDDSREMTSWRSADSVLARPVVVRVTRGTRAGVKLVHAAATTGGIRQASLAPLLDTVKDSSRAVHGVVREWVEGQQLLLVLMQRGLRRDESITLITAIAEALAALHKHDVAHNHLVPGNIFIRSDGRVVVTDPGMRASQLPRVQPFDQGRRADLLALSDIIHLVFSGTWPGDVEDAPGVPASAHDANGPLSPRQVRAGVPRELDALWARAARSANVVAAAPFETVDELLEVVRAMPSAPLGSALPEPEVGPSVDLRWTQTMWGRRARKSLPWLALAAVAVTGWVLGLTLGALPGQNKTGSTTGAGSEVGLSGEAKPVSFRDFDPPPGDGIEDRTAVPFAHDGDTSTSWSTDTYQGSPFLGGIKQGVGIVLDLGSPVSIKTVNLTLPLAGQSMQVLAGDALGNRITDYAVEASVTDAATQATLHPADATPHRYWVIWITKLAKTGDGFRGGISEFSFLR